MGRTIRNFPRDKWIRTPKHKHKLLAGDKKNVVTNWDDKPVAARKENWKLKHKFD